MDLSVQMMIVLGLGLALTGVFAGILAGLLGVGGGIVIVPVLFLLFDLLGVADAVAMHLAVATSLATIIPTSISSARAHYRRGSVDVVLLKNWAPYIFVGSLLGGILSRFLDGEVLTAVFGCIALVVAANMALPKKLVLAENLPNARAANGGIAGSIGLLSALMGIGGGTLSVPILTLFNYPVLRAVGTAATFGLVIAVPAVAGFIWSGLHVPARPPYSIGYVNVVAALIIFPMAAFTAPIGAKLAHRLDPRNLRLAFAVFLGLTSVRMLYSIL